MSKDPSPPVIPYIPLGAELNFTNRVMPDPPTRYENRRTSVGEETIKKIVPKKDT